MFGSRPVLSGGGRVSESDWKGGLGGSYGSIDLRHCSAVALRPIDTREEQEDRGKGGVAFRPF